MNATNSAPRQVVGIIGAGRLGQAMAQTVLRAGRSVVLANSRGPETLAPVVARLGSRASAGTPSEASRAGIVVLCVPWDSILDAVRELEWTGQVLIDATNDLDPVGLCGRTSSEVVAGLTPGARLVKAANTLEAAVLAADPHEAGGHRVIFISGDDTDAKRAVARLLGDAGFFIIDLGSLVTGGRMQQIGGPLASHNLIRLDNQNPKETRAGSVPPVAYAGRG
jgi:8-hydroxy-5-deazaflavin:NADPH oxidoreductase